MYSDSSGGGAASGPSLSAGTRIGRYLVGEFLAGGGGGEVYRAQDTELNRTVAIKLLTETAARDARVREMFLNEARTMASLSHPNIVAVHDFGEFTGRPYAVMELVSGATLRDSLADGPLSLSDTARIAAQICHGLEAIHEAGIVHRDLKPSNIVIDHSGRVKLIDFGLAISKQESDALEAADLSGTLAFMSPEQATGAALDYRSDLFSLGSVLYFMLSGERPFSGDYEASLRYAVANDAPKPLTEIRSDLPEAFVTLVQNLQAKNPDDRPASASDVSAQLEQALSGTGARGIDRQKNLLPIWILLPSVVAVLIASIWYVNQPGKNDAGEVRKMIAVLPFDNLGSDQDKYFADGLTEEITTRLASIKGLGVISRTSAAAGKESQKTLPEIASRLGVAYVLEGSVLFDSIGDQRRVRITPQLVRASDDVHLWSQSFERDLTEIFAIQSEISERIAAALDLTLNAGEREALQQVPTTSVGAYDYYLKGLEYFNRSWDANDIRIAVDMFQLAVDLDSNYAQAWAMLCRGHESLYWEYFDRSEERLRQAREAVDRALELEPDLMEARLARGFLYYHQDRNYDSALAEFQLALASNPNSSELLNAVAAVQRRQGRLEESVANFIRALEIDPLSHINAFEVALTFGMMRRNTLAQQYLEKALSLKPDWPLAYVYSAWLHIIEDGDKEGARQEIERAKGRCDLWSSRYYWWLARVLDGDYQEILDKMRSGPDSVDYCLHRARLYRLMDQPDSERSEATRALAMLDRTVGSHPPDARTHMYRALALAGTGSYRQALEYADRAVVLLPMTRDAFDAFFLAVDYAEVKMVAGQKEEAVHQLQALLSIPGFITPAYLRLDPVWDPLRNTPGFIALLSDSTTN